MVRVPPERIIYANPCKHPSQIKYAASNGVQMMTLDSEVELMIARAHPKSPSIYYVMSRSMWQLMKQIQSHGFPPEEEEQDVGTLPLSCAQESEMDCHPAACASARIN
ncbi:hypothetical protein A6R68_01840, partial [Neotoma lepida]